MAELHVLFTEPGIGELALARQSEDLPGVRVAVEPFVLSEAQRQRRRQALSASELADGEPPVSAGLAGQLRTAEVLVGQDFPLGLIDAAPRLRLIQVLSSGVEHVRPCGIPSTATMANAAGVAAESVAEWVLAQTLAHLKRLRLHEHQQRMRQWAAAHGQRLRGKHVAVVGFGAIGQEVARMFLLHGARVTGVRRTGHDSDRPGLVLARPGQLPGVLERADVVVAALPDFAETYELFDAAAFASMPDHALFINVGRGRTVDEEALCKALETGAIGAACLDVVREEPLPASSPLWETANLTISPHSAVSFEGYAEAVFELTVDNIRRLVEQRPLRNVIGATR